MKPKAKRNIGILFSLIGLVTTVAFIFPIEFNRNPQVWFTPEYYTQFLPLYIAITLVLSGVYILARFSQANLHLAIFGHAASEEIIFNWLGLTNTVLPLYAVFLFFPLSLIALWMAYANTLKKKRLSVGEAIFGIVISTTAILLPRMF